MIPKQGDSLLPHSNQQQQWHPTPRDFICSLKGDAEISRCRDFFSALPLGA